MKQRNLNTVLASMSKTTSLTSDSFLLIMSHISKTGRDIFLCSNCLMNKITINHYISSVQDLCRDLGFDGFLLSSVWSDFPLKKIKCWLSCHGVIIFWKSFFHGTHFVFKTGLCHMFTTANLKYQENDNKITPVAQTIHSIPIFSRMHYSVHKK